MVDTPLKEIIKSRTPNYPTSINITLTALFAAITAVLTILIQVPVPATGGYINIGEVGVMLAGLLFGPIIGGLAGGIGSFISDVVTGYAMFAPWTFIIKGLEGFFVGLISQRKASYLDIIACFVVAGPWMVFGYFSVESVLFGGIYAAFVEVPGNVVQFVVGGVVSIPLSIILRRYTSRVGL